MPKTAATGQGYGENKAQLDAQRAVPMGSPPVAGAPAGPPGPLPDHIPLPGALGDLLGPSQDPNEHVMNGSHLGPGAGPEALGLAQPGQLDPNDAKTFARWLPALQEIASRPDSSAGTRQLVRMIKSRISQVG